MITGYLGLLLDEVIDYMYSCQQSALLAINSGAIL